MICTGAAEKPKPKPTGKTVIDYLAQASSDVQDRYAALDAFLKALGGDIQLNTLKYYFAYKRIKNFACVEIHPQPKRIVVFVKVDPDQVVLQPGFTRDVRSIGHFGTGDLEITIDDDESLERAKPLLSKSYNAS